MARSAVKQTVRYSGNQFSDPGLPGSAVTRDSVNPRVKVQASLPDSLRQAERVQAASIYLVSASRRPLLFTPLLSIRHLVWLQVSRYSLFSSCPLVPRKGDNPSTMLRQLALCILLCSLLSRALIAGPVTYQQIQQDREKQLAGQSTASTRPAGQEKQTQQPPSQPRTGEDIPQFVRLPDGRIVAYGPGAICTENCVEPFEARAPNRPRLWVWGIPLIAGGLIAGLIGSGAIGGGTVASVNVTPTPVPTVPVNPTPTPLPSPTPSAEVPEPSTLILLGLGITVLMRRRSGKGKSELTD